MATSPRPVVIDQAAHAAAAHPLRSRVLTLLRHEGPATASTLARRLEVTSGTTSHHLRRLADVGLITAEQPATRGRSRTWSAVAHRNDWLPEPEDDLSEDDEALSAWVTRDVGRHLLTRQEAWLDHQSEWPAPWRRETGVDDDVVIATPAQLARLREEIAQVVARYRRVGAADPGARRVAVATLLHPLDLDRPPRGSDSSG